MDDYYRLYVVATDGCGNLISVDPEGNEIARVPAGDTSSEQSAAAVKLTLRTWHLLNEEYER
jgi:hypothetical protein